MNFEEADKALKQGLKLRRSKWYNPDYYIMLDGEFTKGFIKGIYIANKSFSEADKAATDWEIFEE